MSNLRGKRVLVTGGAGFIGTTVVRHLREAGAEPCVIDLRHPSYEVDTVVGDIRDPEAVAAAIQPGLHGIVHLAAMTSVLKSMEAPWDVHTTNVDGTATLLERARQAGVERFVSASTNAVVGDVGRQCITEEHALRPLTPYGATKAAAEMLLSGYGGSYGMACCSLRLSNVFGVGMDLKDSMVPRLMRAVIKGSTIDVYGDGEQVRDFVYVDDVARAFVRALEEGWTGATIIGAGESHSVNELVDMTREVTGHPVQTRNVAPKPGEMPAVVLDTSRARSLGWQPQMSMLEGLRATWEDFTQPAMEPAAR